MSQALMKLKAEKKINHARQWLHDTSQARHYKGYLFSLNIFRTDLRQEKHNTLDSNHRNRSQAKVMVFNLKQV